MRLQNAARYVQILVGKFLLPMPSNSSRQTLARHWELLRLLPSRGTGKTAGQLTIELADAGFSVSKRQVERDLTELQAIFSLDCNDGSAPYGWRWPSGGSIELPALTLAEALSLKIVESALRPLFPGAVLRILKTRFDEASAKLQALKPQNRTARWADKVRTVAPALPMCAPEIDADALDALQNALLSDHQIEVLYKNSDHKHVELRLHPLALVNRGHLNYLVATAFEYTDVRLYALHRFTAVKELHERCLRPVDFDIDTYLSEGGLQFGARSAITLEMRVSPSLADYLRESPLNEDQKIETGDGFAVISVVIPDTWQLRWWILSQGAEIQILSPADLRADVISALTQSLKNYSN